MKRFVTLLVTAVLVLAGLGAAGPAAANTLTVASSGEPTTLDPQQTFNGYSFLVTNQVFDTLVTKDAEGFLPRLAASWDMVAETTWRFTLREDVTFHNGDTFNAESVKFSIERLIAPETAAAGAFVLSAVSSVEVVSEFVVDIHTERPFAPLLAHLTHPVTAIVNRNAVETFGEDIGQNPIGTGPFVFERWSSGDDVHLAANAAYWGGAPAVENLLIRVIPEVSTQLVELQSGSIDIMFHVPPDQLATIERNPNISVFKELGWGSTFIGFNTEGEATGDQRVRQAILHALDRDSIVHQLRSGMAEEAAALIPRTVWGAHADLEPYSFDLDLAEDLLEAAGYADGLQLTLVTYQNDELYQLAQAMQFLLGQIGVELTVQMMDYGAYVGRTSGGDYDLFLSGWGTVTLDADYTLYALLHSSEIPENNSTFYRNERVDQLLEEGRATADMERRLAVYHEIQEIIHEEAPIATVYYPLFSYAKQARVQGENIPFSWINLDVANVTLD